MPNSQPSLLVAITDQTAWIKIVGRANFTSSVHFKTLINELKDRGYRYFVLDIAECVTMDSTFLGVLAGFAMNLVGEGPPSEAACLRLLNPNQRLIDLLENLGVAHLFHIIVGAGSQDVTFQPAMQNALDPSKREVSQTCLDAHQALMAINPDNIPKFKDVARFLAEDLKK